MKKVLKVLLIILGIVLLIALSGYLYIDKAGIPKYEVQEIKLEVQATPENIERGKKLASMLCAGCHMNKETGKLTGHQMLDAPPEFGKIFSANITQDNEVGIGTWTDGELAFLLRTGIRRDGQYIPPYMAKLPLMADEDIEAIIAFLRSDDPMVLADPTPDRPSEPSFLTKFLSRVAWKPLPLPTARIPLPDTTDRVALGKYYALNLDCFSCHSADFKTNDFANPEKSAGFFGGGNKPLDLDGNIVLTSNLTPHKETGIGTWTEEQFVRALKYGLKDGEPALRYPMLPHHQLTDYEAGAIFEYLMTVPPIENKIERPAL
jgi:mono/diheme cytochrome c family protein